ncbi:hypothetical protein EDB80DRAFT_776502 [Ilyonectria destructans]|nr:hypothetical protein EDB80DRAFT_776502 [Ilyonectria destructans]
MHELFSFDEDKFQAKCRQLGPQALREEETYCIRTKVACGWAVWFSLGSVLSTYGITLPMVALNLLRRERISRKLSIIRQELLGKSLQPSNINGLGHGHGFFSGWIVQVFRNPMLEFMGFTEPPGPFDAPSVGPETLKAIPQERLSGGDLKITDKSPAPNCQSFSSIPPKCSQCAKNIKSDADYLHCCQCEHKYNICASCAPHTRHKSNHQIYRIKPSAPSFEQEAIKYVLGGLFVAIVGHVFAECCKMLFLNGFLG